MKRATTTPDLARLVILALTALGLFNLAAGVLLAFHHTEAAIIVSLFGNCGSVTTGLCALLVRTEGAAGKTEVHADSVQDVNVTPPATLPGSGTTQGETEVKA